MKGFDFQGACDGVDTELFFDEEYTDEVKKLCEFHKIDLSSYKGEQRKDKIARNLVDYEAGLTIFNTARNIITQSNIKQQSLFDAVS